jgi:uncharacterized protein (DUF488 family)
MARPRSHNATRKRPPNEGQRRAAAQRRCPLRTEKTAPSILTIGHSTRSIDEFIHMLRAHRVTRVVDIRTVPRSRHNPQFNREYLPASLGAVGISYVHFPELGGLRRTTSASPNTGWRNLSFRGYADYMQTEEFRGAIAKLKVEAEHDRVALMCAEAVPWRCHRSLVADALLIRGAQASEISSATRLTPHRLTSFANVRGSQITYPAGTSSPAQRTAPTQAGAARPKRRRSLLRRK